MVLEEVSEDRSQIHVRRKVFHFSLGMVFLMSMLYMWELKWFFLAVLAFGIILSFVQEKKKLPIITWFLDRYDKSSDSVPGQGPLTFFVGAVLLWFLFPENIAFASLIVLTFGDPMAYLGGKIIQGPRLPWNRNKTYAGSISFIIVPFITVLLIFGPVEAAIVSILGAIIESLDAPDSLFFDDNILIPVGVSSIVWLLSLFIGIF